MNDNKFDKVKALGGGRVQGGEALLQKVPLPDFFPRSAQHRHPMRNNSTSTHRWRIADLAHRRGLFLPVLSTTCAWDCGSP